MTEYYDNQREKGEEYQDYVCDQLRKGDHGIYIQCFSSKRYQWERGESAQGVEIKYDERSEKSPNLFIEYDEKTNADNDEFVPSGIMRDDNTWLYLIGNYNEAFLFSKKQLRNVFHNIGAYEKHGIRTAMSSTKTSHGMLVPKQYAVDRGLCLYHFIFNSERK